MNRKLGKHDPHHDPRNLKLAKYLPAGLVAPPAINWSNAVGIPWGTMLNDQLGDCTVAALGHIIMCNTANAGTLLQPSDDEVLAMYEQPSVGNYNPKDPNSDQGANELSVLKYMRATGLAGQKATAFVDIHPGNLAHLRLAMHLFGSAYIGVQLTQRDMDRTDAGQAWTLDPNDKQFLGGHAIPLFDYDQSSFTCISWGEKQKIEVPWLLARMDEAYAVIFEDWFKNGQAPSAFDATALLADIQAVAN